MGSLWDLFKDAPVAADFKDEIDAFDFKLVTVEMENMILKMNLENARHGIDILQTENKLLRAELALAKTPLLTEIGRQILHVLDLQGPAPLGLSKIFPLIPADGVQVIRCLNDLRAGGYIEYADAVGGNVERVRLTPKGKKYSAENLRAH